MNEDDSQVPGSGQGDRRSPQYPRQQYPVQAEFRATGGSQPYLKPPPAPKRTSPMEALALIPAGMYMIFSVIVSILLLLLYLTLLGYIAQLIAFVTCGFLIVSVIAGIYYLMQPDPTPNYGANYSLNMVSDPSEKRQGGDRRRGPQYASQQYQDQEPPQPPNY